MAENKAEEKKGFLKTLKQIGNVIRHPIKFVKVVIAIRKGANIVKAYEAKEAEKEAKIQASSNPDLKKQSSVEKETAKVPAISTEKMKANFKSKKVPTASTVPNAKSNQQGGQSR